MKRAMQALGSLQKAYQIGDFPDAIASRLKPGAHLILAGNRFAYAAEPLLLAAWAERWRMHGAQPAEVEASAPKYCRAPIRVPWRTRLLPCWSCRVWAANMVLFQPVLGRMPGSVSRLTASPGEVSARAGRHPALA